MPSPTISKQWGYCYCTLSTGAVVLAWWAAGYVNVSVAGRDAVTVGSGSLDPCSIAVRESYALDGTVILHITVGGAMKVYRSRDGGATFPEVDQTSEREPY